MTVVTADIAASTEAITTEGLIAAPIEATALVTSTTLLAQVTPANPAHAKSAPGMSENDHAASNAGDHDPTVAIGTNTAAARKDPHALILGADPVGTNAPTVGREIIITTTPHLTGTTITPHLIGTTMGITTTITPHPTDKTITTAVLPFTIPTVNYINGHPTWLYLTSNHVCLISANNY